MTGNRSPSGGDGLADGRYAAVLDRFEETDPARDAGGGGKQLAILLLESGDEVVAERAVPAWRLPEDARQSDVVLEVSVRSGHVVSMTHDPEATERRSSEAQSRFDRLAERPEDSDDASEDAS